MRTIMFAAALLCAACYCSAGEAPVAASTEGWKTRAFTPEELKKYDGRNGMPAYAAVDGIVYDLTRSKYWKGGGHMKMHRAGADLTKDIKERAPRSIHKGGKILDKMPKVGVMAPPATAAPGGAEPVRPAVSAHRIAPEEIGREVRCAVSRKAVKVAAGTPAVDYKGKVYYFSSPPLLDKFAKDPEKYAAGAEKAKDLLKKKIS